MRASTGSSLEQTDRQPAVERCCLVTSRFFAMLVSPHAAAGQELHSRRAPRSVVDGLQHMDLTALLENCPVTVTT